MLPKGDTGKGQVPCAKAGIGGRLFISTEKYTILN